MQKLFKFLKPYSIEIFSAFALLLLQANCDLSLPQYTAKIVDTGVMSGDMNYIIKTGGTMLLINLLGTAASITVGYLAALVAAGVSHDLRYRLFSKVEQFSNAEFDNFSTSSLITRTTNDITQIQNVLVMSIRLVFYAPILGLGGILKAVSSSASMSWIIGVAVLCLVSSMAVLLSLVLPKQKMVQKLVDRLNLVSRENIEGMPVIRAFNTQKFEVNRFDKANKDLKSANLYVNRIMSLMMPTMMLVINIITVVIVWVGAKEVSSFHIKIGDMMAYMQYALQIIMAFLFMAIMFVMVPRAVISAERVAEVLETPLGITDPNEPADFKEDFMPSIEFSHVCFRYSGATENVLEDISFHVKPGQTTAIIGSTGSGKSTLANLVMRFYDVTSGEIKMGGLNIKTITRKALRDKIGYVPQKSVLFSGTIKSNLAYGDKNSTMESMEQASAVAQAAEFIEAKEDGFDSTISQGGTNVSGGQKQRLSIARALVKKAPIYIFDDSFSALDLKTDRNLRAALKKEAGESTILLIAQRVSTIMSADQIIVLDNGRLAGAGTHRELMHNCEVYREIAYSQLSEEELAL